MGSRLETPGGGASSSSCPSSSTGTAPCPTTLGCKGEQEAPRISPGARCKLGDIGTLCVHELPDCRKCGVMKLGRSKTTCAVREISAGQWERTKTNLYNEMQKLGEVIGQDDLKPNTDEKQPKVSPKVTHST